jgi:hypothetical protein
MSGSLYLPPPEILHYRQTASPDYLPDQAELDKLDPRLRPYAFVLFNGSIGAQSTDRFKYASQTEAWILSLVASSSQAAGFAAQFYDTMQQLLWEMSPIPSTLRFGTAQRQFWLKTPYHLPLGGQIQSRIINLANATNAIQIVAWGLR